MIFRLLLFVLGASFLLFNQKAFAVSERYKTRLNCAQIDSLDTMILVDPMYASYYSNWNEQFLPLKEILRLRLIVDENSSDVYTGSFTCKVDIDIQYEDTLLAIHQKSISLYVDYNPGAGTVYTHESDYEIEGAIRAQAVVTSVSSSLIGTPCKVFLQMELDLDRHYACDTSLLTPGHTNNSNNSYTFYWNDTCKPEGYEFEWMYLDNYESSGTRAASEVDFDWASGASRIYTYDQQFTIPNLYSKGFILYRVRRVTGSLSNPGQREKGRWSSALKSGAVSTYPTYVTITAAHGADKFNYGFNYSFIEGGKSAASSSYADGLGYSRQSVAYSPHENTSIVSESYYDHYGRIGLTVLPSPSYISELKYHEQYNRDASGGQLGFEDFDFDNPDSTNPCVIPASALDMNFGSSKYYSHNNDHQKEQQAFLPHANGYPYSRIEYLPDMTGRVKKQTLVGENFRMESGKEILHMYGSVNFSRLNKYLHPKIDGFSKFFQQVTIDPNGQISTAYKDMRGNVVLTATGGDAPDNLSPLQGSAVTIDTVSLLNNQLIAKLGKENDTWTSTYNYPALRDDEIDLVYYVNPANFTDTCLPAGHCYECEYAVDIVIIDDCDDTVIQGGMIQDTLFAYGETSADTSVYDSACFGHPTPRYQKTFTAEVFKGHTYTISKNITVLPQAIEAYTDRYMQEAACLKTYSDFYSEEIAKKDFKRCTYDYCDLACIGTLGERSAAADTTVWDSLFAACRVDCQNPDDCSLLYQGILEDVSPGGQYGGYYDMDNSAIDPSAYPLSVFNSSSSLEGNPNWRNVVFKGYDATPDSAVNKYLQLVPINDTSFSLEDFVYKNWREEFAIDLAIYHPEYCYYEWCSTEKLSYRHDRDMYEYDLFDEANDLGLMDPVNGNADSVPNTVTQGVDSFYYDNDGINWLTWMADSMDNFLKVGNTWFSIWSIAVVDVNCPFDSTESQIKNCLNNYSFGDSCYKDLHWRSFRDFYYVKKRSLVDSLITSHAMDNDCYNGCIGVEKNSFDLDYNKFDCYPIQKSPPCQINFYNAASDSAQPCHSTTRHMYRNKMQRYGLIYDSLGGGGNSTYLDSVKTALLDTVKVNCYRNCDSLATRWMNNLHYCKLDPTTAGYIKQDLIAICKHGCDSGKYAGTSSMASTFTAPNSNKSTFEDVINHYITPNDTCNYYMLELTPPPFYDTLVENPSDFLDTCGCKKVLEIKQAYWSNSSWPNDSIGSAEELFESVYGYRTNDLNLYTCKCQEAFSEAPGSPSWSSGSAWSAEAAEWLADHRILSPPELGCPKCISCETLWNYTNEFESNNQIDTSNALYFDQLTRFVNQSEGYDFSAADYEYLWKRCKSYEANEFEKCHYLTDEGDALQRLFQQYGGTSEWKTISSVLSLNQNPYSWFYTDTVSLFTLRSLFLLTNYGGSSNRKTLDLGNGALHCGYTFVHVDSITTPYNLDDLVSIDHIIPRGGDCDTGTSNFYAVSTFQNAQGTWIDSIEVTSGCFKIADYCCISPALCETDTIYNTKPDSNKCQRELVKQAKIAATDRYNTYIDSVRKSIRQILHQHCLVSGYNDTLEMYFEGNITAMTAYHYDLANNLVQTSPPLAISSSGVNNNLTTHYRYNTFNQVIQSETPDGGATKYWYDIGGRLILSQNEEQVPDMLDTNSRYSYTLYDPTGRVVEVGQVANWVDINDTIAGDPALLASWWTTAYDTVQITKTFYDDVLSEGIEAQFSDHERLHLRNRVATVAYYNEPKHDTLYETAVHYRYDGHGNVVEVLNDISELEDIQHNIKRTLYEFDLISGNVNKVRYEPGMKDGFTHHYTYDQNNRLSAVRTSRDEVIWQNDARYEYYDHGPLARVELANTHLQGLDYFYTINGWLKGVNSNTILAHRDPGRDGSDTSAAHMAAHHQQYAVDIFGFELGYFPGDYQAIADTLMTDDENPLMAFTSGQGYDLGIDGLYNGNIAYMTEAIEEIGVHGNAYSYDQLNRIVQALEYTDADIGANKWGNASADADYMTYYEYDLNGNLDTVSRNGVSYVQQEMDRLKYHYNGNSNQIWRVEDSAADHASYSDIKEGQGWFWNGFSWVTSDNYQYDAIGRLTRDVQEDHLISWSIYNKPLTIQIGGVGTDKFLYSPLGQRQRKMVDASTDEYTYYTYDAGGALMGVYSREKSSTTDYLYIEEHPLYGNSRIGSDNNRILLREDDGSTVDTIYKSLDSLSFIAGDKQFEFANHLGNVLATTSDRKLPVDSNSNDTVNYYLADVSSRQRFYPYGMLKPDSNNLNIGDYRFGF